MCYYLRLALVALLTLTLPLSAFADVGLAKRCVMNVDDVAPSLAQGSSMTQGSIEAKGVIKDCCDPVKAAKSVTKKDICKTGQECNASPSCSPAPAAALAPTLFAPAYIVVRWQAPAISSHLLDSLWRPPRSHS